MMSNIFIEEVTTVNVRPESRIVLGLVCGVVCGGFGCAGASAGGAACAGGCQWWWLLCRGC